MKLAIINRAVPGSGKSTFAKAIKEYATANGTSCAIHSTDDLFMIDGVYKFNPSKLGEFHAKNLENFNESCEKGVSIVICDNTGIHPTHCLNYASVAETLGYMVIVLYFKPSTLENHLTRNTHNVPEETLKKMISDLKANPKSIGNMEQIQFTIDPDLFSDWLKVLPKTIHSLV